MFFNWREISGNWVYLPDNPRGIVHFLGGAFVAAAPHITYRLLLEDIAKQGYAIVTTPFVNTFDHRSIVDDVYDRFEAGLEELDRRRLLPDTYLPIYGIGHSMGCKLHLLLGSLYDLNRAGNIFISFNNFSAKDSVPLLDRLPRELGVEFTPDPQQTLDIIYKYYDIRRNLIIKFNNDTIDQSYTLGKLLSSLFPDLVISRTLGGNHLTPIGQDFQVQLLPNVFTPFDAIGQWFKQEIQRDLYSLRSELLYWLDPTARSNIRS
jgi:hypothetical protein